MARLPTPGGDSGTWDDLLNALLTATGVDYALNGATAAGATTFTLDRTPSAEVATSAGFLVVDKYSTTCEIVSVSSAAGAVITPLTSVLATGKAEFVSGTKTIKFRRAITSIVGSAGTVTVTTGSDHKLTTGDSVAIYGTTAFNEDAVTVTVTGATTFTYADAAVATESAGFTVLVGNRYKLNTTNVGRAIVVTGSASNNATFTVASIVSTDEITVTETVVSENAGNTATLTRKMSFAHADGARVSWWPGGEVDVKWFGAKSLNAATHATTNTTAFNRCFNNIYSLFFSAGIRGISGTFFAGVYWVDGELCPDRDQALTGSPGVESAILSADAFPFTSTGEVAIIHPRRDGCPTSYAGPGSVSSRWPMRDFAVSARNLTNGNLILASPQQPDHWEHLALKDCIGLYGICLIDTQHHSIKDLHCDFVKFPLRFRGAAFIRIEDMTVTGQPAGGSVVLAENLAGGLATRNIRLRGFQIEDIVTAGVTHFKFDAGTCISIKDYFSTIQNTTTVLHIPSGGYALAMYTLENFEFNGGTTATIIDDDVRGITRGQADFFHSGSGGYVLDGYSSFRDSGKTTSVSDGGTISHKLGETPNRINVTPSVAGEMVSVTAASATTFTVAIKKHDNTAGTAQTLYWQVSAL